MLLCNFLHAGLLEALSNIVGYSNPKFNLNFLYFLTPTDTPAKHSYNVCIIAEADCVKRDRAIIVRTYSNAVKS